MQICLSLNVMIIYWVFEKRFSYSCKNISISSNHQWKITGENFLHDSREQNRQQARNDNVIKATNYNDRKISPVTGKTNINIVINNPWTILHVFSCSFSRMLIFTSSIGHEKKKIFSNSFLKEVWINIFSRSLSV